MPCNSASSRQVLRACTNRLRLQESVRADLDPVERCRRRRKCLSMIGRMTVPSDSLVIADQHGLLYLLIV